MEQIVSSWKIGYTLLIHLKIFKLKQLLKCQVKTAKNVSLNLLHHTLYRLKSNLT